MKMRRRVQISITINDLGLYSGDVGSSDAETLGSAPSRQVPVIGGAAEREGAESWHRNISLRRVVEVLQ
jgi:hypothetical protein